METKKIQPTLKQINTVYRQSKANGLLSSQAIFDAVTSPNFSEVIESTKRNVRAVGTPDPVLTKFLTEQGFSMLPTQVSDKEFSLLVKSGLSEIYRGVRKDDAIVDFATNPDMFVGKGIYCNGIYFMYGNTCPDGRHGDTSAKARAERYIHMPKDLPNEVLAEYAKSYNQGQVIRALVRRDSKVIEFKALRQLCEKVKKEIGEDKTVSPKIKEKLISLISEDLAIVAAIEGFDVIDVPLTKYMIVLNRGKLIMNKEDVEKSR